VRRAIKLPDIQNVRFIFEDRRLVVVHVKIVWSGKECHHGWETSRASFPVHAVPAYHTPLATIYTQVSQENLPSILRLMGANDGQQTIALKERAGRLVGEEVRAAAYMIVHEALRSLLLPKVLHWIGPEDIAHETGCRRLTKAIELKEGHIRLGL